MSTPSRLAKDIALLSSEDSISDVQFSLETTNSPLKYTLTLSLPEDHEFYPSALFYISLEFADFPLHPPSARFLTQIYHLNISAEGEICSDILKDKWSPSLTVKDIISTLISLLKEPVPDSALRSDLAVLFSSNKKQYIEMTHSFTEKYAT